MNNAILYSCSLFGRGAEKRTLDLYYHLKSIHENMNIHCILSAKSLYFFPRENISYDLLPSPDQGDARKIILEKIIEKHAPQFFFISQDPLGLNRELESFIERCTQCEFQLFMRGFALEHKHRNSGDLKNIGHQFEKIYVLEASCIQSYWNPFAKNESRPKFIGAIPIQHNVKQLSINLDLVIYLGDEFEDQVLLEKILNWTLQINPYLVIVAICSNHEIQRNFPEITFHTHLENFMDYLFCSKGVISRAGHNMTKELLFLNKEALIIPNKRLSREQFNRAQYLKKQKNSFLIYSEDEFDRDKLIHYFSIVQILNPLPQKNWQTTFSHGEN